VAANGASLAGSSNTAEVLKVTYTHELLGVVARGCRFADVLSAIGRQTGISVELPGGSGEERIFFEIAPAPVPDVLQSLLDGAEFNYVILWSRKDPKQLARIILSRRTNVSTASAELNAPSQPSGDSEEPALYQQGFGGDPNEQPEPAAATPVAQADPGTFTASDEVTKRAAAENKTPGQVLEEMQKELMQKLDAQAARTSQQ
jgi:hypothetical protein